jgi:hypothetical protein
MDVNRIPWRIVANVCRQVQHDISPAKGIDPRRPSEAPPTSPQCAAMIPRKIGNNRLSWQAHAIDEAKVIVFSELLYHLNSNPTGCSSNDNAHTSYSRISIRLGEPAPETTRELCMYARDHKGPWFAPIRRKRRENP